MKRWLSYFIGMVMFAVFGLGTAAGQAQSHPGTVAVPPTNAELPQDIGRRAHTNFLIFVPAQKGATPFFGGTSPGGETPSSLACVYQTGSTPAPGCPVNNNNYDNPAGGSKVIAIVDAYDYPTACNDFNVFSSQFGLPTAKCNDPNDPHFRVVYATGSQPRSNCGWAQEAALDIEWAHAMAPQAQIILVEAASNSNSDLLNAVDAASNLVAAAGGGQVSMSWGSSEFSSESTYDSHFSAQGVTYFASSGDSGGKVIWPSASANVISAGGTSVQRDSNGNFSYEGAWSSAGAGPSKYVPVPDYQSGIQTLASILNGSRGTPDFSFDADPYTGVSVYDSTSCQGLSGWLVFGGTSVSSPSLAGIFNLAGAFNGGWDGGGNSSSVQNKIYQSYDSVSNGGTSCNYTSKLYDVTQGSAGSYPAKACWDFASAIGTARGVSALAGSTTASFSLSASPTSLSLTAGGTAGTSTISLTPSGGYTGNVTLSVTTTLPDGMTVTFGTNPVDITGTNAVSSTMTVSTTTSTPPATYDLAIEGSDGSLSKLITVPVTVGQSASPVTVSSLTLNPTSVTGGNPSTGTVTLSGAAPLGGAVVALSSDDTSAATVPASVTVAAGNYTANFNVMTYSVTTTHTPNIAADYNGSSKTAMLTVNPASSDFSISASPGNVTLHGGSTATYSVTVTPSGGFDQQVIFSMTSQPSGPTATFSPTSVTGSGTSTMLVTAPSGRVNYTLTITGSVSGGPTHSVTVGLKVH
jgi:hypothetical protein